MADHIKIRAAQSTWVVRAAGAVIGESSQALELCEGDREPVIYFPRKDIAMAFFDPTGMKTHCPHKGDASHFTIELRSGPLENAAWSYQDPHNGLERIKDHLAFYSDRVTVEQL
ncbi:MAG: hypothetical protein ACJA1E_002057 [Paracoccaceae bacterium]|jgi:uncharacterized protein (DUF427 family)